MGRRSRDKKGPYIPKLFIRELRKERELSMVDVLQRMEADGVVMTEASLSRIERSLQPVDTPALHAIAKALGVSVSTVLTGIRPDEQGIERLYERLPARERGVARRLIQDLLEDAGPAPAAPLRKRKPRP